MIFGACGVGVGAQKERWGGSGKVWAGWEVPVRWRWALPVPSRVLRAVVVHSCRGC